jgi:hypothetical protein
MLGLLILGLAAAGAFWPWASVIGFVVLLWTLALDKPFSWPFKGRRW